MTLSDPARSTSHDAQSTYNAMYHDLTEGELEVARAVFKVEPYRLTDHNVRIRTCILELIEARPGISCKEMAEIIGYKTISEIYRYAQQLCETGFLWEDLQINEHGDYVSYRPNRYRLSPKGEGFIHEVSVQCLPITALLQYCRQVAQNDDGVMQQYLDRYNRWKEKGYL